MKKTINQEGFGLIMGLLLVVIVAIIGYSGWNVYQSQHKTNNTLGEIAQSQLDKAATTIANTKTTATPATPKNELDTLKEFCQGTDPNTVIGNVVYVENADGKFGSCGVGDRSGAGATLISYIKDGNWTKIVTTQNILPVATCTQYKLPSIIGFCYEAR